MARHVIEFAFIRGFDSFRYRRHLRICFQACTIPASPSHSKNDLAIIKTAPWGLFLFLGTLPPVAGGVGWRTTKFGLRFGVTGILRKATSMILLRLWESVRQFVPCEKLLPS